MPNLGSNGTDILQSIPLILWNSLKKIMITKMMDSGVQDIRGLPVAEAANRLVDIAMIVIMR